MSPAAIVRPVVRRALAVVGVAALATLAHAQPAPVTAPTPVPATLVLQWNHQAQFAGYYVAQEQGFYRREGIDLRVRRGGPDISPVEEVRTGRAEFCSAMLSTALEARAQDVPLVLLTQLVNRSNFILVAWKHPPGEPGVTIARPTDLTGRKVTVWETDFRLPYLAFFSSQGVQPELLPQYYTFSLFLHHGAAACAAMRYNEYHRMMQNGLRADEVVVFNLWEHGVNLPEDGVYALERTWRERPDLCRAFERATLAGWRYAKAHPDAALDAVMRQVAADNVPTNRPHMRWMLREILRSMFPESGDDWSYGRLSSKAYAQAVDLLRRHGNLQRTPSYAEFVTTEARDANVP